MKELLKQFQDLWRDLKTLQKWTAGGVLVLVVCMLGYLLFPAADPYLSLFSGQPLSATEISEVRTLLQNSKIPYQEKGGDLLVHEKELLQVRQTLNAMGIPKNSQGKGFELFDTNTWIKGEKELQVLEMRALKGQLEKDLCSFDNIKSANVILDLAPPRPFGGQQYKTKASVILSLKPSHYLTTGQLKAISNHLSGAVRGLDPHMIAISDTSGRLYQSIDGLSEEPINNFSLNEEQIETKVHTFLTKLIGAEHFFTTVNVREDKTLFVLVVINQSTFSGDQPKEAFSHALTYQLQNLLTTFAERMEVKVEFTPFAALENKIAPEKKPSYFTGALLAAFLVVILFIVAIACIRRFFSSNAPAKEERESGIDFDKLADALKNAEPSKLIRLLTTLSAPQARKILLALPEDVQEKVLKHLTPSNLEEG